MNQSAQTLRIAMIQMAVTANKRKNLETARQMLRQAADQGAQMAVLPEMFCCPYDTDTFPLYAEPAGGLCWQAMAEAAQENHIYLAAGSMPEAEHGHCYNTTYIFDPDGKQIARHRKIHLFDIQVDGGPQFRESDTLTAGNQVTVFDTIYGKMGAAICYDLRFPELARLMAFAGAQILIIPAAFNMTTGPLHWQILFQSRAIDNQLFTVGVAPARSTRSVYVSYAHSIAVSPWGRVLSQMDIKPGIGLVDLDLNEVTQVREQLPLLQQRRTDLYTLKTQTDL